MMRSVERTLAVFESFAPDQTSLTLQEIADSIELPKSTAFRIVGSLEEAGYLVRLEDQRYCLSFRFTRLAGLVRNTLDIRAIARPAMLTLAEQTQETVAIHMAVDGNRVCVDSVATAPSQLRSVMQPGEQIPLLLGSASKTLLAFMPETASSSTLAAIARATQRKSAEIRAQLSEIRDQGYAVSHGERLLGLSAISAPVWDANGEARYCITVNGPSVRIQMHEKAFTKLVKKAAGDISRRFGGPVAS
ncbi:IclR family transcriptional regulator [Ideonella azotifigens]|uniref:IclR family transcriptional regulator n=1 Tax=Ideonella azotifigens TaxID=513160 RepID=A0ABN1JYL3_9BURK|nr:IclR family transcriptional regulator [Ideonella azotifigens]MCD2341504.1 IclR family transcriptional regulator [Ideonella azotifigens]